MKGLIQVTATKGGKTITAEVYGNMNEKDVLFSRLMNRYKIVYRERYLWKLSSVKLNEVISL
jgi:hypothetical protein